MAERINSNQPPQPPPVDPQQGGIPPRGPQGVGGDRGGINPPDGDDQGIMDMLWSAWKFCVSFLRSVHDLSNNCEPVRRTTPRPPNDHLGHVLHNWFPEKIRLLPRDNHDIMKQELGALSPEDFTRIIQAYNDTRQVDAQRYLENITVEQFIDEVLTENVTLELDRFAGHEELIRPYGLHQRDLEMDLDLLPDPIKIDLRRNIRNRDNVDANTPLEEYFKDHMGLLKELLEAYREG